MNDTEHTASPVNHIPDPTTELKIAEIAQLLAARNDHTRGESDHSLLIALLDVLGNPHTAYPSIHITGTNGKTSTARMIDSLAQEFLLRTGCYTNEHLTHVTERISIDGNPIDSQTFVELYAEIAPFIDIIDQQCAPHYLSGSEIFTAMAFVAFSQAPVDVAIVEASANDREDVTNVLAASVDVITPIAQTPHESLTRIAQNKASIITKLPEQLITQDPVVITAVQPLEAMTEIISQVEKTGAIIARADHEFGVISRTLAVGGQLLSLQGLGGRYDEIFLPLHGAFQGDNAAVALASVEAFFGAGKGKSLDPQAVRAGFAHVCVPGRLEPIAAHPTVIIDAAANSAAVRALAAAIQTDFHFHYLVGVIALDSDSNAPELLRALEPVLSEIIITAVNPMPEHTTAVINEQAVQIYGPSRVHMSNDVVTALGKAIDMISASYPDPAGTGVIVTGSLAAVRAARIVMGEQEH